MISMIHKSLFILGLIILSIKSNACGGNTDMFVTTWQTNIANPNEQSLHIVLTNGGFDDYSYNVDWDCDGEFDETDITGDLVHTFGSPGTYQIGIYGDFPSFKLVHSAINEKQKLVGIEQWGTNNWRSMSRAFQGASNLVVNATDIPNLSSVSGLNNMFEGATYANPDVSNWDLSNIDNISGMFRAVNFNPDVSNWDTSNIVTMVRVFENALGAEPDVSNWNTSSVTNMSYMFSGASSADPDVSGWDTSNVTNMSNMFSGASSAEPDVSSWDTSNVTRMNSMFRDATKANPDVSGWDTSNVTYMSSMFFGASSAEPDVSGWDTSNVTSMVSMFFGASNANPDVSGWDTSNVTDMSAMYYGASNANPDVSGWDTSNVTRMNSMFRDATKANPDVSGWDTSNVTDMSLMYYGASNANPDVSDWDTSNVLNMGFMFFEASSANPDVSGWDTSNVTDMSAMYYGASNANPDVSDWDTSNVVNMGSMFFEASSANPDVSGWDTSNVTNMGFMFFEASSANPDVSGWDTSNVTNMNFMFSGASNAHPNILSWNIEMVIHMYKFLTDSSLPPRQYDLTLQNFASQNVQSDVDFSAGDSWYCDDVNRQVLINKGWDIFDAGQGCGLDLSVSINNIAPHVVGGEIVKYIVTVKNTGYEDSLPGNSTLEINYSPAHFNLVSFECLSLVNATCFDDGGILSFTIDAFAESEMKVLISAVPNALIGSQVNMQSNISVVNQEDLFMPDNQDELIEVVLASDDPIFYSRFD